MQRLGCNLCSALNEPRPTNSYHDLAAWWRRGGSCKMWAFVILFVFSLSRARIQFGWANFGDYLQNVSICDCVCFCLRSRLCNTSYKDRCCHFPPQRQIHEIHLWGEVVVIFKKGRLHPKAKICQTKHCIHPTNFHVFCRVSGLYCTKWIDTILFHYAETWSFAAHGQACHDFFSNPSLDPEWVFQDRARRLPLSRLWQIFTFWHQPDWGSLFLLSTLAPVMLSSFLIFFATVAKPLTIIGHRCSNSDWCFVTDFEYSAGVTQLCCQSTANRDTSRLLNMEQISLNVMSTRAQWDFKNCLEELAHMFFNVKLNFWCPPKRPKWVFLAI